ncbi:MAG: VWA domain-containing protein [Clostridiales bacterium]|nr:VWA domain-containing protein [Clostridiales bacterium]
MSIFIIGGSIPVVSFAETSESAASEEYSGSEDSSESVSKKLSNVKISVKPSKSSYSASETVKMTVTIKNNSNSDYTDVVLRDLFDCVYLKCEQGKTVDIGDLDAGETKTVELTFKYIKFNYECDPVSSVFNLVSQCIRLITLLLQYVQMIFPYTTTAAVKVGGEVFNFVFSAVGKEKGSAAVKINKECFSYSEDTSEYSIIDIVETVDGTLTNSDNVDSLFFDVKDANNNLIDSGTIDIAGNWTCSEIDFILGENILTVTATCSGGEKVSDAITVKCYTDAYMQNVSVDCETDTDGDGLADYLELNYTNTDINNTDTDGDGLSDYYDVYLEYDPLAVDTDENGIIDADEDYDGDGISNVEEIQLGLDPAYDDSDLDGLNDYEEINTYGTDPLNEDTDGDGVSDGDEVRIGSDPLSAEESFAETVAYGETSEQSPISVEVTANLTGDQVGTLDIDTVSYADNVMISPTVPGYLGDAYDFTVDGEITGAEITFNYDSSLGTIGDDFQPRIYYYNEETKAFEELANQTVEEGKVTATTTHFSTYILLNKVEFDKVWETEIKTPETDPNQQYTGLDIVFVIDSSGSMAWNDEKGIRKSAVKQFIEKLSDNDRGAVVDFDSSASVYQGLTSDKSLLTSAVDRINSSGGTSLSAGISTAINLFTSSSYTRTDAYNYIIFLTDGDGSYSTSYTTRAAENNIIIYTIGLGSGVKESTLKAIAEGTGGKYYFATLSDDLESIYEEISFETIDYTTDTNGDGIPDYYNELIYRGELVLTNGSDEFKGIDFNYGEDQDGTTLCDDLDGDGLLNGEELKIVTVNGKTCIKMISDPCMVYSDDDDYNDMYETLIGTDPLVPSYLTSAVEYFLDDSNYTYYNKFKEESGVLNTAARNIWSTITLNFSHKDEAQGMITKFLTDQATIEGITETSNQKAKKISVNVAMQAVDQASDIVSYGQTVAGVVDKVAHLKVNIKKWNSAANSIKNLNLDDFWTNLTAQIKLFDNWKKSWKIVSEIGDELDVITVSIDEIADISSIASTYSSLAATSQYFKEFEDILITIANKDDMDEKYVAKAVQPILESLQNDKKNFSSDFCRDLAVATTENLVSIGLTLLSKANPFLGAVNTIVGLIDKLYMSDITEGAYALYVVNELVDGARTLVSYKTNKAGDFCSVDESQKIYFRFIYSARLEGGKYAMQIVNKQIFIGEKDKVVRQQVSEAIDSENSLMKKNYDYMNL